MMPLKWFDARYSERREEKFPKDEGIVPARSFTDNVRYCKGELTFETSGMDPVKLFHPRFNLRSDVLLNRAGGMSPPRLFSTKSST